MYILVLPSLSLLNPPPLPFSYVYRSFLFFILSPIIIFFIHINIIFTVWKKTLR
jgi:hypothetical protein